MTQPTPSIETGWQEPDVIAKVEVRVYALESGQVQIRVRWPDGVSDDDTPEGQVERKAFVEFVQSELEVIAK